MMLVTVLSTGKGSWSQVYQLISSNKWDSVIIVTDDFGKSHFSYNPKNQTVSNNANSSYHSDDSSAEAHNTKIELINVNFNDDMKKLSNEIYNRIKDSIRDLSVGLNLYSGDGKTHMALLYALIKLGVGIELVYYDNNEVKLLEENL